ncbi:MAG: hypothetical protein ACK5MV_00395 [Aminipila sp.]
MENIIQNLLNIGYAIFIFSCAYLANMAFSIWYNVTALNQPFEWSKIRKSFLKAVVFVIGITLLCIAITMLPIFASEIGWTLPEEYTDLFQELVIVFAFLNVTCKYIKEAYQKFVVIVQPVNSIGTAKESKASIEKEEVMQLESES